MQSDVNSPGILQAVCQGCGLNRIHYPFTPAAGLAGSRIPVDPGYQAKAETVSRGLWGCNFRLVSWGGRSVGGRQIMTK